MMHDPGVGSGAIGWVTTACMPAAAIMVPVTGLLHRSVRTHRLLLCALGLLLAGTVLGALAPNLVVVLVARIVQVLGTGMVVPIGMNLTLTVSPPERLGTTMGIVSAMTTLGPSSGPIVAGAILRLGDRHLLFALFAVLVAAAWVAALVCVGDEAEITRPRLDAASTALISLALVGVLHGISTIFTGPVPVAVVPLLIALARPGRLRPAPGPHRRAADRPAAPAHQELRPRPGRHRPHAHDRLLDDHRPADVPAERAGPLAPRSGRHAAAGLHPVVRPVPGRRRALRSVRSARLSPDRPRGRRGLFTGALSRLDGSADPWLVMACCAPVIAGTAFTMGPAQTFALAGLERPMHPHCTTIVSTCFQTAGCIGSSLLLGFLSGIQASRLAAGDPMSAATASGFRTAALVAVGVAVAALALSFALAGVERSRRTGLRVRVEPQPGRERIPADERTAADGSAAVGGESVVLD